MRRSRPKLRRYLWRIELKFWAVWRTVRYPSDSYRDWRKWHDRPKIGEQVEDCRGKIVTVTGFKNDKDTLLFDDGTSASWMYCCDRPPV